MGRVARRGGSALAAALALCALAGCASEVDVSFKLTDPCGESVLGGLGCMYLRVVVSSQDPGDDLYPGKPGAGPLAKTCDMLQGSCSLSGDELLGLNRVVDVLCMDSAIGQPLGRATSNPFLFEAGDGGADGMKVNLLIGPINTFIKTTVLQASGALVAGQCSQLAQSSGRFGHTATLLEDGRVLIVGGIYHFGMADEVLTSAEIFDPRTGIHSLVLGPSGLPAKMTAPSGRAYHTATRLRDGRVLLAGGVAFLGSPPKWNSLRSAEIFDPVTNTFGSSMDMLSSRAHHTATMLATGKVLLTGGAIYDGRDNITSYVESAVLFDPSAPIMNAWTFTGTAMNVARAFHQAVLLDPQTLGGKVLILGGENSTGALSSTEIYKPDENNFYVNDPPTITLPTMSKNRSRLCAVRLLEGTSAGKVLVIGGTTTTTGEWIVDRTAELFDPVAEHTQLGGFTPNVATLSAARMEQSCVLLDTGGVLVVGGLSAGNSPTGLAELVTESSGAFTVTALPEQLNPPRFRHAATTLANGWVLLTGGLPSADQTAATVMESVLFVPPPLF
ncbi:MAG TPA: kelch repeat-containing protein [Myxococcota bacterium]|nr:kelch repeat-containing protein [Myxococcota bacterium]HRY96980.1 kelch repeat-containing protein [Myxococcota bacterium]